MFRCRHGIVPKLVVVVVVVVAVVVVEVVVVVMVIILLVVDSVVCVVVVVPVVVVVLVVVAILVVCSCTSSCSCTGCNGSCGCSSSSSSCCCCCCRSITVSDTCSANISVLRVRHSQRWSGPICHCAKGPIASFQKGPWVCSLSGLNCEALTTCNFPRSFSWVDLGHDPVDRSRLLLSNCFYRHGDLHSNSNANVHYQSLA